MDASSVCFACTCELDKEDEIVCSGFCTSSFYLKCVKQSTVIRDSIAKSSNLFWMCNACSKMMQNATFRQTISSTNNAMDAISVEHNKALLELRNEMEQNSAKINKILQHIPAVLNEKIGRKGSSSSSRKRPRLDGDCDQSSPNANEGTKDIDSNVKIPLAVKKSGEELFWLYLSGFDPKATEEDIRNLVQQNLNTSETVDVRKLVPKGKNLEELSFVSFKVGVGLQLKTVSLLKSSWQKGIIFREFDFHTRSTFRFQSQQQI
ncbi:uncharacterized protein LOC131680471 [Topomyia yanbarensis]|uniref:uncharacterized protein LOC131680471 n=1 Tax=Topomyia yanbarensis TaxID=2498891 RepID=UPI00273B1B6D|nr:uncharacterized protein LOC131680471 [Topomyia yanbarensis]